MHKDNRRPWGRRMEGGITLSGGTEGQAGPVSMGLPREAHSLQEPS